MRDIVVARQIIHDICGFTKSKIEVRDFRLVYDRDFAVLYYARFTVCGVNYIIEYLTAPEEYQLYATVKEIRKGLGRLL